MGISLFFKQTWEAELLNKFEVLRNGKKLHDYQPLKIKLKKRAISIKDNKNV